LTYLNCLFVSGYSSILSRKEWADLLNGGAGGMDEHAPYWLDENCIDEYLELVMNDDEILMVD